MNASDVVQLQSAVIPPLITQRQEPYLNTAKLTPQISTPTAHTNTMSDNDPNKPHAFNPPGVPIPPPTYSQMSITPILPTSKLVTLAGQVGLDSKTNKVADGFDAQVKLAYVNILNALKAAGATPRDIIHVKHFIVKDTGRVGVESEEELTRVWGHHWMEFMDREGEGHRPPDTVLGVAALATEELLYECEVWAIVHGG